MLSSRSIIIRPLEEKYIQDIVRIHRTVLGYTINSRLGDKHLAHMYRYMSQNPECYTGVAFDDDTPVGIISGTVNMERTKSGLLGSLKPKQWLNIALKTIREPSLIAEWQKSNVIGRQVCFDGRAVDPILTSIGVDPNYQGKGVGKQLIGVLEKFFVLRKIGIYHLDTLSINHHARAFYKNLGFQEVDTRSDSVILVKRITE